MTTTNKQAITVECIVNSTIEKVWNYWTMPEHITQWNNASEDWFTPRATNDLTPGGKFLFRMEARDGSFGFDFEGIYDEIILQQLISYKIIDGRKVSISFIHEGNAVKITETFDPENENSEELQIAGWQAIINNFKKYTENN